MGWVATGQVTILLGERRVLQVAELIRNATYSRARQNEKSLMLTVVIEALTGRTTLPRIGASVRSPRVAAAVWRARAGGVSSHRRVHRRWSA
jgi:hypothetical protein